MYVYIYISRIFISGGPIAFSEAGSSGRCWAWRTAATARSSTAASRSPASSRPFPPLKFHLENERPGQYYGLGSVILCQSCLI